MKYLLILTLLFAGCSSDPAPFKEMDIVYSTLDGQKGVVMYGGRRSAMVRFQKTTGGYQELWIENWFITKEPPK